MTVQIQDKGPVRTVVIDRPERKNAVDRNTAEALADAFEDFDAQEHLHCAVLTGSNNSFCAGADLAAVAEGNSNRLEETGRAPMGISRLQLSKPVIAAIEGHAVAGGLELALWCDLRVAAKDAVMGVFCRRFGVPLIDGGTVRLPRLIGMSRALDMILTGRPVDAVEGHSMGLVNRVVAPGEARAEAEALALQLCGFPQACLRADRASALRAFDEASEAEALRSEFRRGRSALDTEGLQGAVRFNQGAGRHGRFSEEDPT